MGTFGNFKRGMRQLPAAEFQRAGQLIDEAHAGVSTGNGGPADRPRSRFIGDAPHDNDFDKWFTVKITSVVTVAGKPDRYTFDEVGFDHRREYLAGVVVDTVAETVTITGGRVGLSPDNPGFAIDGTKFKAGDYALCRRSRLSPYVWELAPAGAGRTTGFWGRLVGKSYVGNCPVYTYEKLADDASGSGTAVGCSHEEPTGTVGTAYEVNGVDLPVAHLSGSGPVPVAVVVWLEPLTATSGSDPRGPGDAGSGGPECLFVMEPRWEFVEKTANPAADGTATGEMLRWAGLGATPSIVPQESVYIIDLNAL